MNHAGCIDRCIDEGRMRKITRQHYEQCADACNETYPLSLGEFVAGAIDFIRGAWDFLWRGWR